MWPISCCHIQLYSFSIFEIFEFALVFFFFFLVFVIGAEGDRRGFYLCYAGKIFLHSVIFFTRGFWKLKPQKKIKKRKKKKKTEQRKGQLNCQETIFQVPGVWKEGAQGNKFAGIYTRHAENQHFVWVQQWWTWVLYASPPAHSPVSAYIMHCAPVHLPRRCFKPLCLRWHQKSNFNLIWYFCYVGQIMLICLIRDLEIKWDIAPRVF